MSQTNPCQTCGACCAFFRVSFHWLEANAEIENPVPLDWTEDLSPHLLCMRGTNSKTPRCAALMGQVGQTVACAIYANRPSPCHEFGVQEVDGEIVITGEARERCNHARVAWKLPAIS